MPLPPQLLKALMDVSTGRLDPTSQAILSTPNPNLPPSLPQAQLDQLGQPSSPGNPGYVGPFAGDYVGDSRNLQKQLIDSTSEKDLKDLPAELTPVSADKILDKHKTIPGTQDEAESVAL